LYNFISREKKVPIKIHSEYEWRIKRKIIPLNQKVKEILTLYGIYSFHNNLRYFDFYSNQNIESFVKFIKK